MVKNLSKISKSNIAVSITGIAGPAGGTKKNQLVWFILVLKKMTKSK